MATIEQYFVICAENLFPGQRINVLTNKSLYGIIMPIFE